MKKGRVKSEERQETGVSASNKELNSYRLSTVFD